MARSPDCENHNLSKKEVLLENLGNSYVAYTRKIPFDNYVGNEYHEILKSKIITASIVVRYILFRTQLFVNYYTIAK